MKRILLVSGVLAIAAMLPAQQKTTTTCMKGDVVITCESTTTDTAAEKKADQDLADAIIGKPIMNWRVRRGVKKYCKQHPGEPFHWTMPDGTIAARGTCPAKH